MLHKIEEWKDIDGYEGYYQVSNLGNIKSLDVEVFNGKVMHIRKGRVLKLQTNGNYNKVSLSYRGKVKQFLVHRLVAKAFLPNKQNKPEVNHIDYDCFNNCVSNLEWVTAKENDTHKRCKQ